MPLCGGVVTGRARKDGDLMAGKTSSSDPLGRALLLLAVVGVLGLLALRWLPGETVVPDASAEAASPAPDKPAAREAKPSAFRKLQGRWLRPDGGYILDLKWVGEDGRVEAAYLNPRTIYVSRAEASEDGGRIKLLVELQDVGYPGCVYTLHHDAEQDVLVGAYYQAAMGETFAVEFVRTE